MAALDERLEGLLVARAPPRRARRPAGSPARAWPLSRRLPEDVGKTSASGSASAWAWRWLSSATRVGQVIGRSHPALVGASALEALPHSPETRKRSMHRRAE